ncbi:MAG: DNA cytosine methyltransferase [Deltaproteobacteria bacterium]|nr:DNA cytosine methyltransferase [Deltaproteobacteria bacterium]
MLGHKRMLPLLRYSIESEIDTSPQIVTRLLLEQAERLLIGSQYPPRIKEPLNLCGDRYRRSAFKLACLNANALKYWQIPNGFSDCEIDFIDLFCGCGGVSAGFLALNNFIPAYRLAGALDIDPNSCQTFKENFGVMPHQEDIRLFLNNENLERFLNSCDIRRDKPLVLIGCPPCQGFSSHRKKAWNSVDRRNDLVEIFAEIAVKLSPDFVFMENVPELLSEKYWEHFKSYRETLENSGYKVAAAVLNMAKFGVPQERHRAIVLASRKKIIMPEGYLSEEGFMTVRQAISHLEPISPLHPSQSDPMHFTARHRESTIDTIKQIPKDGGSRPPGIGPKCLDKVKGFYDVYGRLHWDRPSITITAYARNPASGRYVHPEQDRGFSIREAAILQSFPEGFIFEGSFDKKFSQIGNAVPPRFAAFVAAYILGEIASSSYHPPKPNNGTLILKPVVNSYSSKIAASKLSRAGQNNKKPLAVDAFCGAGGLSLGLKNAGFDIAVAYDNDEKALKTYRHNLGCNALLADANMIDLREQIEKLGCDQKRLILIAGGPPCQGFSVQRRGDDSDSRNSLVSLFFNQAIKLKPPFILMENVLGLRGKRGKALLEEINRVCLQNGYFCHIKILNAADFGVPQIRKRMFIVAEKIIENVLFFEFPKPNVPEQYWKTVREAVGDLPPVPENGTEHPSIPNHRSDKLTSKNKERFSYVKPSGGREQIPPALRLPCHRVDANTSGHRYVYGRLDWEKPAGVITARFDSLTRGRFGHPDQNRTISLREGARLQSFPDSFVFLGNKVEVARQIGNAVPPLLSEKLGGAIIDAWKKRCSDDRS